MLDDIRTAFRALRRAPAFSLTALLTLSLAAAAAAAILAIVYGILLKPLPYHEPHRLVAVWPDRMQSNEALLYLRERSRVFSSLAAVAPGWTMSLTGSGDPAKLTMARVSGNLFDALGTPALLGRTFTEHQARPGADQVVVLSHDGWTRWFAADPRIVGRIITLEGLPFEVVAVMPRGFEVFGLRTDGFTPFAMDPKAWYHRLSFSLYVGRLVPGQTLEQADREYKAMIPEIRRDLRYAADYGRTAHLRDLRAAIVGDVSAALVLLAAAVALTLLLAAANVASLQLTRAASRRRDFAVRASLGASRARLARELFAESALLALGGGVLGMAIARPLLRALAAMLPKNTPRVGEIAIEPWLAAAVVGASVLLAIVLGMAPALAAMRTDSQSLRTGNSSEAPRSKRARGLMVSAEIAFAVVLTIGAGLMLQTLRNLQRIETGFDAEGVLTLHAQPSGPKYRTASVAGYYEEVLDRIRALPGVTAAGAIQHLPFSGYSWNGSLDIEGFVVPDGASRPVAGLRIATPQYFEAVGQPVIAGRGFERADAERGTTVIVNEALATKYYGSTPSAIGRRLRIRGGGVESPWMTIAGVVKDVRHSSLTTPPVPEIYTSVGKSTITAMMLAIRTSGEPLTLIPAVRSAIWSVDREVPLSDIETMRAKIASSLGRPRLLMTLLVAFAGLGVLLAIVGVYGVVAYSVTQRRREIGIMVALGAERARVMRSVLREGLVYGVAGLAVGLPAAFAASRLLRTLVFGVKETDPATYALMAVVMLAVVSAACLLPALRAARTDPALAVRQFT